MNSVQYIHRYFLVCIAILLLFPSFIHSQTTVHFSKRYETDGIFGDLTIIGNSIFDPSSDTPYYGTSLNDNINMVFVDIDGDPSTFSSSSATFTTSSCNRVVYAGLYWGAFLAPSIPAPNEVKFKILGGTYQDLTADANLDLIYYKDVTDIVTTNLHASGDYYVANVSSTLGKQNSTGWSLVIDQLVDLDFSARTEFSCEGSSNQIIASVDPEYANEVTYTLDDTIEQATGFFEDVADGEHTLTVEHNSTGYMDEPISITVHAYRPVVIGDLVESGLNEYAVIATNREPQYEYAMNDENVFSSSNVFDIISSGTYIFYVRDMTGCVVERSFELEFLDIEIPNFFTPDGDGINDTWYPRNIEIYPNLTVVIFDRYQRLIATYKGNRTAWSGYYNNKLLPSGDYWYTVKLNQPDDTRVFKGNFTLYR